MSEEPITSQYVTRTQVNAVEAAREVRNAWYRNRGLVIPPETPTALDRWTEATETVFEIVNQGLEERRHGNHASIAWRALANRFQEQVTQKPVPDGQEAIVDRLWEAAVRLIVNIILAADSHELHEALAHDFRGWILGQEPLMRMEEEDGEDGDSYDPDDY